MSIRFDRRPTAFFLTSQAGEGERRGAAIGDCLVVLRTKDVDVCLSFD
jgi:hypothetical protein